MISLWLFCVKRVGTFKIITLASSLEEKIVDLEKDTFFDSGAVNGGILYKPYIAVDNAKGVTQYGGTVAAPIAKNILTSAIDILDIKMRKDEIEREYSYLDKQYATVPNVVGMSVSDAIKLLKQFKVEYSGDGDTISYQAPSEGTKIYEGETIRLLLN